MTTFEWSQEWSSYTGLTVVQIQWKLMPKFTFKFKNPIFGPFLPISGPKKFSQKTQPCGTQLDKVSSTMEKFRKTWWSNSKKTTGQVAEQEDRQILFHRTLPATARASNKYNCCRLAFKSQRYRVRCWPKPKIIASQSACKKSPKFIISFLRYSKF